MKFHEFYRLPDGTIARAELHVSAGGGHWVARLWRCDNSKRIGWRRVDNLAPSLGYSDETHPAAAESIAAADIPFWRQFADDDAFHLYSLGEGLVAVICLQPDEIEHRTPAEIEAARIVEPMPEPDVVVELPDTPMPVEIEDILPDGAAK